MDLAVWQIILLVILAACTILDALTLVIGLNFPVITGTLAGIIMGDMVLGLAIGGGNFTADGSRCWYIRRSIDS